MYRPPVNKRATERVLPLPRFKARGKACEEACVEAWEEACEGGYAPLS